MRPQEKDFVIFSDLFRFQNRVYIIGRVEGRGGLNKNALYDLIMIQMSGLRFVDQWVLYSNIEKECGDGKYVV